MAIRSVDSTLLDWSALEAERKWPTLLIGNGVSINLWANFAYQRLFDVASLNRSATQIFGALDTTNFETVLEAVHHARLVADAQARSTKRIDKAYNRIQRALFDAVRKVHIEWSNFPGSALKIFAGQMNAHEAVFTTNYDLSLYWSHMEERASVDVVDFFWGPGSTFDSTDTQIHSANSTPVHYLHGGIHLWRDDETGVDGKWTREHGRLLSTSSMYGSATPRQPLFVSEGTAAGKLRTIRRSEYLSFCREALQDDTNDTIVLGSSLGPTDAHILAALRAGTPRQIAVSMLASTPDQILVQKARYIEALHGHTLRFFDAATHPLTAPSLRVQIS